MEAAMAARNQEMTPEMEWKYAEPAMRWYGWASPVGVGLFLLALGGAAALFRFAFWG
jgi:hypothetical protein